MRLVNGSVVTLSVYLGSAFGLDDCVSLYFDSVDDAKDFVENNAKNLNYLSGFDIKEIRVSYVSDKGVRHCILLKRFIYEQ